MRTLLKKFEHAFGSSAQIKNFGRSDLFMIEIESARMIEAAAWLRMEESFRMDYLENLSVYEAKDHLFVTAFVRSLTHHRHLVLRTSVPVAGANESVSIPSLIGIWSQAEPFEAEISPLFGVQFTGVQRSRAIQKNFGDFGGYPLRKAFDWGEDFKP